MTYPLRIALLASALSLAACQQQQPERTQESTSATDGSGTSPGAALPPPADEPQPGETDAAPTGDDPANVENDGRPDLTPVPLTGEGAKGVKGARAILLPWARGIELREFDQSWAMMGDAAKSQLSKAAFNAMFHPLRDLFVAIPDGTMEGAAGSSYYTVPTTVTGTAAGGSKKTYKGEVVMRRVNDVDGATPEQLTWHIEKVDLKPVS